MPTDEQPEYENIFNPRHSCITQNGICCNLFSDEDNENESQKMKNSRERKKEKQVKPLKPHPKSNQFYVRNRVNKKGIFKQICQKNVNGKEDFVIKEIKIPTDAKEIAVNCIPKVEDVMQLPTRSELSSKYENKLFRESKYQPDDGYMYHFVKRKPDLRGNSPEMIQWTSEKVNIFDTQDIHQWFNKHDLNETTFKFKDPNNNLWHRNVKRFGNNYKITDKKIRNKPNYRNSRSKITNSNLKQRKEKLKSKENEDVFNSINSEEEDFESEENDFESQQNDFSSTKNSYLDENQTQNDNFSDNDTFQSISESEE